MAPTPERQYWKQEDGDFAFKILKERDFQPRILYLTKLSLSLKVGYRHFQNLQVLKAFTSASFFNELLENVLLQNESKPRQRKTWDTENRAHHRRMEKGCVRRQVSDPGNSTPTWECSSDWLGTRRRGGFPHEFARHRQTLFNPRIECPEKPDLDS